jgi:hypothetical protein
MSRRAKIILTGLLLALLSVPLVYTVLTWRPLEPLRFRATALREQHYRSPGEVDFQVYEIEVENTSGVPIHIIHGEMSLVTPSASTFPLVSEPAGFLGRDEEAHLAGRTLSHAILEEVIIVPAYGKVRCIAGIYQDATAFMSSGHVHIAYRWMSGTKQFALGITTWIQEQVPGAIISTSSGSASSAIVSTPPSFPAADHDTARVHAESLRLPPSLRSRHAAP